MGKGTVVAIKQNTKQWSAWRDKGLGASDAPVVMDASPWTTSFQLWGYKTGILIRPAPNQFQEAAMKRGHDLEPLARDRYEAKVGKKFPATSFQHHKYEYLRASLDGYCESINKNLEIKCPGKVDHAKAVKGEVPEKYMPQLQMQMLVSGAESSDYFSWDGKDSEALITVVPDRAYQEKLLTKMVEFWVCVNTYTPPSLSMEEACVLIGLLLRERLNKAKQGEK